MRSSSRRRGAHAKHDAGRLNDDHDRTADEHVGDTRERFGGIDLPAAFAGTMAALGMLAVLGAIASGWYGVHADNLTRNDVISATGVAVAIGLIVLSAMFGGWVSGRAARYSGAGNGFLTGFLLVMLAVGLAWLTGSLTAEGADFRVPAWITTNATASSAAVTGALAAGIALLSSTLGGALGSFWHRRVDRALVTETEDGLFTPYPEEQRLVTSPPGHEDHSADQEKDRRTPARTGERTD